MQGGSMSTRTLGLIGSAAGGLERIRPALIEPAIARGWQVAALDAAIVDAVAEVVGEKLASLAPSTTP